MGLHHANGVGQRLERVQRGAEARLIPWALELVQEADIGLEDLDGVAVSIGPGSFTGLRVGMAAAMGLAQSLERPIWGSTSLHHRAMAAKGATTLVMLDARKGRVYAGLYGESGQCIRGPSDIAPEVALEWVDDADTVVTGEGALVYRELCEVRGLLFDDDPSSPAVTTLATLGASAIRSGLGQSAITLSPQYFRDADAKKPKRR